MAITFNFNLSSLSKNLIAAGGGGSIYDIGNNQVLKYFHVGEPLSFEQHLIDLKKLPANFVKPIEIFQTGNKIVGYTMPFVDFSKFNLFNTLFNKMFCNKNNITTAFKVKLLSDIKEDIKNLHKEGIIIGDFNQYNLFYSLDGSYLFIDTDAFQTLNQPHSGVLIEEIQDYLNPVSRSGDMWSYTILSFWALTFVHPFKWVLQGNKDSLEQRVRKNMSILNTSGVIIPALYVPPDSKYEKDFLEIFKGRRYFIDFDQSAVPLTIQVPITVSSIALTCTKIAENILDIEGCKDYLVLKTTDNYKILRVNQKGMFFFGEENVDRLVVNSLGKVAIIDGNVIGGTYVQTPTVYYNQTGLSVVAHDNHLYSFNLELQMAGISHNIIPAFAKSFILRDSLIQNFGASKYLVIPRNGSSLLSEIPTTTKNAYVSLDYAIIEYTDKGNTKFLLKNWKTKQGYEVDYYAYFCENGDMIFMPDDGKINIIKNGLIVGTLDISICTKSSKLLYTTSGIVMLENKQIYLLNTK